MMKNSISTLLFALAAWVLFLSSGNGYGAVYGEGVTGAPGDELNGANPKTCQFCHSTGTFGPPTMTIQFFDSTGTRLVTTYQAGKLYIVRVSILATTGLPLGYGFQMIDIQSGTSNNAKSFLPTAQQNTGIQVTTLTSNTRQYAEHTVVGLTNQFNVKWRAKSANLGNITFYASGTAVNGNGDRSGDGATFKSAEFIQTFVSTNDLAEKIKINLSENPVTEGVTLSLTSPDAHLFQVRVTDLSGRNFLLDSWKIAGGENQKRLHLSHLPKGAYMIQVVENQDVLTKKIIKL